MTCAEVQLKLNKLITESMCISQTKAAIREKIIPQVLTGSVGAGCLDLTFCGGPMAEGSGKIISLCRILSHEHVPYYELGLGGFRDTFLVLLILGI